jgi:hypothetical protein
MTMNSFKFAATLLGALVVLGVGPASAFAGENDTFGAVVTVPPPTQATPSTPSPAKNLRLPALNLPIGGGAYTADS